MGYKTVPQRMSFDTEFNTYVIAMCPDTNGWFTTNNRFWYYQYPLEFKTNDEAIKYFIEHKRKFHKIHKKIMGFKKEFDKIRKKFVYSEYADIINFNNDTFEFKTGKLY